MDLWNDPPEYVVGSSQLGEQAGQNLKYHLKAVMKKLDLQILNPTRTLDAERDLDLSIGLAPALSTSLSK